MFASLISFSFPPFFLFALIFILPNPLSTNLYIYKITVAKGRVNRGAGDGVALVFFRIVLVAILIQVEEAPDQVQLFKRLLAVMVAL